MPMWKCILRVILAVITLGISEVLKHKDCTKDECKVD